MRIIIVEFSDGGKPLYFIDGTRHDRIEGFGQLLSAMLGRVVDHIQTIWITSIDQTNPEPWEELYYLQTEDALNRWIEKHPYLVEV